jgi:hypothetical protein
MSVDLMKMDYVLSVSVKITRNNQQQSLHHENGVDY